MKRAIPRISIPALPDDSRQFDSDLISNLRGWSNNVNTQLETNFGPTIIAAPTITVTSNWHHVAGTGTISTIVAPAGVQGTLYLVPDSTWSMVTGGNIALAATAVKNQTMALTYDGSLWHPSYTTASTGGGGGGISEAPTGSVQPWARNGQTAAWVPVPGISEAPAGSPQPWARNGQTQTWVQISLDGGTY